MVELVIQDSKVSLNILDILTPKVKNNAVKIQDM